MLWARSGSGPASACSPCSGGTVWYTAPTAIRMLMRGRPEDAAQHDLSALRVVASVGEPLNAEAVRWGAAVLHRPVHERGGKPRPARS